ncbi:hypothetical protein J2TS6_22280 [Paenibacillus albilobatus]|uniref:Uncharacterized protein n=1 Tax=Paenibacillus albilobatus TaxID=2716884 RepID=A0A919XHX3_9BACL|nr:hypothetical protein J2TS6_22280 [Paenibacillus albilobatus]
MQCGVGWNKARFLPEADRIGVPAETIEGLTWMTEAERIDHWI